MPDAPLSSPKLLLLKILHNAGNVTVNPHRRWPDVAGVMRFVIFGLQFVDIQPQFIEMHFAFRSQMLSIK
jgi:hypothetical protein